MLSPQTSSVLPYWLAMQPNLPKGRLASLPTHELTGVSTKAFCKPLPGTMLEEPVKQPVGRTTQPCKPFQPGWQNRNFRSPGFWGARAGEKRTSAERWCPPTSCPARRDSGMGWWSGVGVRPWVKTYIHTYIYIYIIHKHIHT